MIRILEDMQLPNTYLHSNSLSAGLEGKPQDVLEVVKDFSLNYRLYPKERHDSSSLWYSGFVICYTALSMAFVIISH